MIAACLILVGVAAFQSPSGLFEESSLSADDVGCDLNSSDSFVHAVGLPEPGAPHVLRLNLAECESGTLKSVYYDISGPTMDQIYNTDPIHELSYVFMKSGEYTIEANYSVELTNGNVVRRKLPLDLVIK
jgi:hypothetical protein